VKFEKFSNPFHPGEMLLEEFLQPMKLTQSAFAEKLGWSARKLNEIIKGKRGVTAASALDLADELKTTPEYWMNLQMTFDLAQAYRNRQRQAA
jgi:addiction module HigA family antidote